MSCGLQRELNQRFGEDLEYSHRLFVLTDGQLVFLEEQPERVLARLAEAATAMCLVCLSDLTHRILARNVLRISTRQLSLF